MTTLVFQVLTLLFGAFLTGCAAGSFGRGVFAAARQVDEAPSHGDGVALPPSEGSDLSPSAITDLQNDNGDDLTRIVGIDAALAQRLNGLGIWHLDQIARWSNAEIDWVEAQLGEKERVRRQAWVGQALRITGGDSRMSE